MAADSLLQRIWYDGHSRMWLVALLPLSWIFGLLSAARRFFYRAGWLSVHRVAKPVIVVGNISVGGTGKTPFVKWLAARLQGRGLNVAIVLRGYGGRSERWPREVTAATPAADVGDEALLHAMTTGAIVVAAPDRVAAAQRAIELGADLVICDDGLQHYRLGRDCEIAVIDAQRGLGNGHLLPAGPLRETASRLQSVDLVVNTVRGDTPLERSDRVAARTRLHEAVNLMNQERRPLDAFRAAPVHALAGIGNPDAFFSALRSAGLTVDGRAFPDHAALTRVDIEFGDSAPVLMTQKDAVKCRGFADERHWAVPLELDIEERDAATVLQTIDAALRRDPRSG